MTELTSDFFAMLRLAKRLSDSPLSEKAHKRFGFFDLNEDHYYELSYEATTWVFKDTSYYYKEESEVETWVFCDPVIDRFCQLCGQYERRNGLSEEHNRYRKRLEQVITCSFEFSSYSYDFSWRLSAADRGRKRILFCTGPEFYDIWYLPECLLNILDEFEQLNRALEQELNAGENSPAISQTPAERKEAA